MECRHLNGNRQDNRLVNLCWGTRHENIMDAVKHGTWKQGTKLVERDVRMIIYLYCTKLFRQREIAKFYGVHQTTVHYIVNKRTWKHIWRLNNELSSRPIRYI